MNRVSGLPHFDEIFSDFGFVLVKPTSRRLVGTRIRIMLKPWFDPNHSTDLTDDNTVRLAMYDAAERAMVVARNHFDLIETDLRIISKPNTDEAPFVSDGVLELIIAAKKAHSL